MADRLAALGYVETVLDDPDRTRHGVVRVDVAKAQPGVSVYCSVGSRTARFLDLQGETLRTLSLPEGGIGADCLVEPYRPGYYLALTQPFLALLDGDSRLIWKSDLGHHHDFAIGPRGEIYTFTEREASLRHAGRELPLRSHWITVLTPEGAVEREIDLLALFADRIPTRRKQKMLKLLDQGLTESREYHRASDVLHPNTVEWLPRPPNGIGRGQLLVCLRELDLIAVIDVEREAVVWSWGRRTLDRPHHPSALPDGNLLIFDNGRRRGFSRILWLDPAKLEVVREYRADPPWSFFSRVRGSVQALSNGNLLITESTKGHVFEVTSANEIVWDFWNPEFDEAPGRDPRRRQIYRMHRLEDEASVVAPRGGEAPLG